MITQLRLINWKSYADATLHVDPLTIVIGTNASGKSNVLDALVFLQRVALGRSITEAIAGNQESAGLRGGLEWSARKPGKSFWLEVQFASTLSDLDVYRYQVEIVVNGIRADLASEALYRLRRKKPGGAFEEQKLFETGSCEDTPSITASVYTGKVGAARKYEFNRAYTILGQIEKMDLFYEVKQGARFVQNQMLHVFILDPIPSHMRGYSTFSERLLRDASNIAGVLAALPEERRSEVEAVISTRMQKFPERDIGKVWTEPIGKFQTDAMLYCEERWRDDTPEIVDLRGMSDGTLRFLAILVALLTGEENSLLVIEEVDNGLHPSRAHVLVSMLRELGKQRHIDVIVTTHNPALLDALGNRMVPYITVAHRDAVTGASALTLLEDIVQLPKLMASGTIGRLATQGQIEEALGQRTKAEV